MRISLFALILPLAACGPREAEPTPEDLAAQKRFEQTKSNYIPCAKPGVSELSSECVMEQSDSVEGLVLTIRHPDGGFRRLLVTNDGRGVVAADGALPATVEITSPTHISVTVAGERYSLPATIKDNDAKP